ncbi:MULTISPECIES: DUF1543 domain-containing protein [Flavobacterium]|uniref:DUF1543 domain-containing protein n=1 Tax=Flavobacterium TaxID=237 RepID=UPI001F10493F|nr:MULTISPECIES: DUF1543 domain-containing protein [Flavobacterium]
MIFFFGIGNSLKELIPHMNTFWPEAKGKLLIDTWREAFVMKSFSILFGLLNSRFKTSYFKPKNSK